jgi:hypothetical protein
MGNEGRFRVFFEKHVGFGIRWDSWCYALDISIALPFVTFNIGLGKEI